MVRAAGAWDVAALLGRPRTAELALGTVALTAVVTLASVLLGVGLALAAVRMAGRTPLMVGLLAAPLALPSYVVGFAWTRLLPGFGGFWAAALVLSLTCYPLVLLPVAAALSTAGRSLEDVARTLGRGPLRTFCGVTLRRHRSAIAGGALLAALYALGDFGGPASVRYETFTVGIYNAYHGAFDRTVPAIYSLLLIAGALVLTAVERLVQRGDEATVHSTERAVGSHSGSARVLAWAVMAGVLLVAIVAPVVALVRETVQSRRLAQRPAGDVLAWLWPDLVSTVAYAAAGALVVTVLAIPVALFTMRPRRPTAPLVEFASYLGYTLPGITVGLAFVFAGIRLGRAVYLTPALLIACYAALFLPLAVRPIRAAFDATPVSVPDAARTLGAGPWATLWRVRLPLALPAVAGGAMLVGLTVAKELPATLLLRPIGTQTLATHLWSLSNDGATGEAALLAVVLVVVTAVPAAVLSAVLFTVGARR